MYSGKETRADLGFVGTVCFVPDKDLFSYPLMYRGSPNQHTIYKLYIKHAYLSNMDRVFQDIYQGRDDGGTYL
ncbi:hypothetical protein OIU79_025435 [Salix purpurea]|uniref:Uncharacterized protein n=1 Tax=Salix purpurea TaxID=77065 RepID=A0A9Q1A7B3_SALPP|nr:hypothetical protein OIU79_025435 [Salix purpurea]